jgi:hypothetical protein
MVDGDTLSLIQQQRQAEFRGRKASVGSLAIPLRCDGEILRFPTALLVHGPDPVLGFRLVAAGGCCPRGSGRDEVAAEICYDRFVETMRGVVEGTSCGRVDRDDEGGHRAVSAQRDVMRGLILYTKQSRCRHRSPRGAPTIVGLTCGRPVDKHPTARHASRRRTNRRCRVQRITRSGGDGSATRFSGRPVGSSALARSSSRPGMRVDADEPNRTSIGNRAVSRYGPEDPAATTPTPSPVQERRGVNSASCRRNHRARTAFTAQRARRSSPSW